MKIIALMGRAGSGKDTIAKLYKYEPVAFADELKRITFKLFKETNIDLLWGESKLRSTVLNNIDWKHTFFQYEKLETYIKDLFYFQNEKKGYRALLEMLQFFQIQTTPITVRYILQQLGTEWGRTVEPDVWLNRLKYVVQYLSKHKSAYSKTEGVYLTNEALRGVVITDCRFENEIKAVHELGGKVIWVDASKRVKDNEDRHASEPLFIDFKDKVDGVIDNNGKLEDIQLCHF